MSTHRLRHAVRALVIDENDHFLMVRLHFPDGSFWVLPGGGIEPGEDAHDALRRELQEEIGLVTVDIGTHLWNRTHLFSMTDTDGVSWDGQFETCHLVRVPHFDPTPAMSPDDLLREHLVEHRWWSVESVDRHVGKDVIVPRELSAHVRTIITHGAPSTPWNLHDE